MPKLKGQENQRVTEILVDQYRREYFANIEIMTGDPYDLQPYNWKAPLSPPWLKGMLTPPTDDHDVVRMVPRNERSRKGYQVFVDHQSWIDKNHRLMEAWRDRFEAIAREGFKGQQLVDVLRNPPVELIRYMGPGPFPPVEFIQAMQAKNDWALGFSDVVPAKAEALLEQIKPYVITMRGPARYESNTVIVDPFADDDTPVDDDVDEGAQPWVEDPFGPGGASRLGEAERYADLEEQFDPQATGGKKVQPRRKKVEA